MEDVNTSLSALAFTADGHDPLKDIELPRRPPPGFDPFSATHDQLLEYGLPPPPDKGLFPEQYRQWKDIFSKPPVLATEASVKTISKGLQTVHGTAGLENTNSWAGAIVENTQDKWPLDNSTKYKSVFGMVSASWTVTRPYPPSSSRKDNSWVDGDFQASTWVGMGGSTSSGTDIPDLGSGTHVSGHLSFPGETSSLLCAGIAQRCVARDGVMEFAIYPWFAWHPSSPVEISGFAINPGDLITVVVCGFSFDLGSRFPPFKGAFVFFYNKSNCTYFSAIVKNTFGRSVKADAARWIVQCPSPPEESTMPFLGTNFIYDCWLISNGAKKDLSDAVVTNAVADDGKDLLLQATRETDSVLRVSSQRRPHDVQVRISRSPRVVVYHQSDALLSPLAYFSVATGRCPPITHLNIAAFHLNEDDNTHDIWVTLNNNKPDDSYFDSLWKDVKTLQVHGVKVLAMLGGAVGGVFSRLDKDPDSDTFKKSYGAIKDLIETYNFDGVDLDVEETMSQKGINYLIDRLVDDFGDDFLITLAPVARALMGDGSSNLSGFNYITLEKDRGDSIAWYNAQFYNGWGSMEDTTDYGSIMDNGFKPQRVVAGVLTNSVHGSGYVDLDTLKKVLKELVKKYGGTEFGGVAAWEYEKSNPDPTEPWQWAQVMRDTLG